MRLIAVLAMMVLVGCVVPPQLPVGSGRFLRINQQNGDVAAQLQLPSPEACQEYVQRGRAFAAANPSLTVQWQQPSCTEIDSTPLLPYRSVIRDDMYGSSMQFASRTEATCNSFVADTLTARMPSQGRFRFSVVAPCERGN